MFLSLAVWLGGIILFSVLAPTAFSVLPSHYMAALIVGPMLSKLHWMGIGSGIVFLICAFPRMPASARIAHNKTHLSLASLLICLMLALTCISQFAVMPQMAGLRKSVGDIETLASADPVRMHLNALHAWSTRLEGAVLLLGLIALYLVSRQRQNQ
jgi:hypothetical protein